MMVALADLGEHLYTNDGSKNQANEGYLHFATRTCKALRLW